MKLTIITRRYPGLFTRRYKTIYQKWISRVGLAALPIGDPGERWVGIALDIPGKAPNKPPKGTQPFKIFNNDDLEDYRSVPSDTIDQEGGK